MIVRRLTLACVVSLGVLVGLLVGSPLALAVRSHGFSSSFGVFVSAHGVAVDDSAGVSKDDVYVVDQGAPAVERFTASEAEHNEPGATLTGATFVAPTGVAVDDSSGGSAGDVYVADPGAGVVDRFSGVTGKFLSRIDGSETPDVGVRGFEPVAVAVDPANGEVFVADAHNGLVDVFSPTNTYVSQFAAGLSSALTGVTVNGEGNAYVTGAGGEALELLAEGGYTSVMPVGAGVSAVGVNPVSGDVYMDEGSSIVELDANGESLGSFGSGSLEGSTGVGVDNTSGTVYASDGASAAIFPEGETPGEPTMGAATGVSGSEATLHGELAGGESGYYFAYSQGSSCTGGASTEPTGASGSVAATATLSGLQPATGYTVCLVATNAFGQTQGAPVSFTTSAVPATIEGESFSDIGSSSVTLNAQIDPNGTSTGYYWEYGPSTAYGSTTPEVFLGEGHGALPAPADVEGLAANSEYHFRVVAVNTAGTERGADATFRTLSTGLLGLPDGRVYERVTPTDEGGFNVYTPEVFSDYLSYSEGLRTQRPFRAAANGDGVVYVASPSTSGGSGSSGEYEGDDYLATRSSGGGWTQVNLQPQGYRKAEYQAFSDDLSVGWLVARGESAFEEELPPLSPEAPSKYEVLYARSNSDGVYWSLFTKTATIHRGEGEFGAYNTGRIAGAEHPAVYAGSSADLTEMLFEANDGLTENAVEGGKSENNLYLSVDGRLSLVNVLPDGSSEPNATFGAPPNSGEASGKYSNFADFDHVISADGSRVFWTQLESEATPKALYVRENPGQPQSPLEGERCTVPADACSVLISEGARFWTATADGSKAFYTKGDLYEYEVEDGQTTDLTPGVEVQGVIGASEDGEYVYYVTTADELELWHAGTSTVIAQLSAADGEEVGPYTTYRGPRGDWTPGIGTRTAEVAPDGLGVVFMSRESLPVAGFPEGYRNEGMQEVYVYEAEGGGRLFCASCNPSGEPPETNEETEAGFLGRAAAGFLPLSFSHTYAPRVISEGGGRVFFDSDEPLVAQDTNGKQDVYEWERDGLGSCREANGCIYLLSGGTSGSASWLLDASTSGEDVFVISRAELVPGDPYESFAVYDARVGGMQPVVAPQCTGSGCQGVPPAAPIFATPASATFAGVGNFPAPVSTSGSVKKSKPKAKAKTLTRAQKLTRALRACRKRGVRARAGCEAQARKRYGAGSKAKGSARKGR